MRKLIVGVICLLLDILGHGSKCLDIMGLDISGLDILGIIRHNRVCSVKLTFHTCGIAGHN